MKARSFIVVILLTISNLVMAQDLDYNRDIMKRVMQDSENYLYGQAQADSFNLAVKEAVGFLANQIETTVKTQTREETNTKESDGVFSEETFYSSVVNTFTDVRLSDYHVLMTQKPSKKNKKYEAFVYISSRKVKEILDEKKREEEQAAAERFNKLKSDIKFYYDEGTRAVNDLRIGDALKYYYWAYAMADGKKVMIEHNHVPQPAESVLSTLLDQTLDAITIVCTEQKEEAVNEFQTSFMKTLLFSFNQGGSNKRITCLDFKYNNGYTFVSGPRVRDGVSQAELNFDLDRLEIHCVYNYDESETPNEIATMMKGKSLKTFSTANKFVDMQEVQQQVLETESISQVEPIVHEKSGATEPMAMDSARTTRLYGIMGEIENAIRAKKYETVGQFFTENGYDCFDRLIRYGNATIIGAPQYNFMSFGHLVICNGITLRFRFKNNKQFVENINFRFNDDDLIESLAFALTDVAQHDIMDNKEWKWDSKLTLLTFMEDYQTAYALKRIDYLEKIFSENALIISGYKVLKKTQSDGLRLNGYTHYDTLTKSQFLTRLRRSFNSKEYINLNFTDTEFTQAWNTEDFFGVRVRQEYFSNTYGDVGYLFLLVDLRGQDPIIHVRAWQDDKLPIDKLFSLKDVY